MHQAGTSVCAAGSSASTATTWPTGTSLIRSASMMIGIGHLRPIASIVSVGAGTPDSVAGGGGWGSPADWLAGEVGWGSAGNCGGVTGSTSYGLNGSPGAVGCGHRCRG